MNYSIIFTEISFYPETSILLQIIIHSKFRINAESDRVKGGQSACSDSRGFKHDKAPTDRKFSSA